MAEEVIVEEGTPSEFFDMPKEERINNFWRKY